MARRRLFIFVQTFSFHSSLSQAIFQPIPSSPRPANPTDQPTNQPTNQPTSLLFFLGLLIYILDLNFSILLLLLLLPFPSLPLFHHSTPSHTPRHTHTHTRNKDKAGVSRTEDLPPWNKKGRGPFRDEIGTIWKTRSRDIQFRQILCEYFLIYTPLPLNKKSTQSWLSSDDLGCLDACSTLGGREEKKLVGWKVHDDANSFHLREERLKKKWGASNFLPSLPLKSSPFSLSLSLPIPNLFPRVPKGMEKGREERKKRRKERKKWERFLNKRMAMGTLTSPPPPFLVVDEIMAKSPSPRRVATLRGERNRRRNLTHEGSR